jgi:hypothetical protein
MPIADEAKYCDSIIKNCGELGMYVVLDYHCMLWVTDGGQYDINNFWKFYAPRYKDQTHVLYELENEPFQHPPDGPNAHWNPSDAPSLNAEVALYKIVRTAAPEAVILAGYEVVGLTDNWGPYLKKYATAAGFSWTSGKDVWSWHDYAGTLVDSVRATWNSGIPMICGEFSYSEDGWYNVSLQGEKYVAQWCEREGMSWMDWKSWNAANQAMQLAWLIPDAQSKGWAWWNGAGVAGKKTRQPAPLKQDFVSHAAMTTQPNGRIVNVRMPSEKRGHELLLQPADRRLVRKQE